MELSYIAITDEKMYTVFLSGTVASVLSFIILYLIFNISFSKTDFDSDSNEGNIGDLNFSTYFPKILKILALISALVIVLVVYCNILGSN